MIGKLLDYRLFTPFLILLLIFYVPNVSHYYKELNKFSEKGNRISKIREREILQNSNRHDNVMRKELGDFSGMKILNGIPENNKTKCIFYDKPERTGSTSVSATLHKCLIQKGYSSLFIPDEEWNSYSKAYKRGIIASRFVAQPGNLIAHVKRHVHLSKEDLVKIKKRCFMTFYITSTAPMRHRILSRVKYDVEKGVAKGNFSYQLNYVARDTSYERTLTNYPYAESDVEEGERWIPNYVIKKSSLHDDLTKLLKALQCRDVAVKTRNNHNLAVENPARTLEFIEKYLTTADFRYRKDILVAKERNKEGLKQATLF